MASGRPGILATLLNLPAFLFSVFVFYWSLPIFALPYRIRFLNFGLRNDMLDWAKGCISFFAVTILRQGELALYQGGPCLYLCNHRSWADFFVDTYLTQGRAALMSRWLVYFVFPFFCTSCIAIRGVILFKRGSIADKEAFNKWLDGMMARGAPGVPSMLVYPEGHRSLKPHSLPLKRGMLHYAYGRKLPVQIVMTSGKDQVMSEKTRAVHFGRTLVTTFSKVLKPSEHPSFDAFMHEVQTTWDACWKASYEAKTEGLPRVTFAESSYAYDYPRAMRLKQAGITLANVAGLFGAVWLGWKALAAALAATGPAQQYVAGLLAVWVAVSMIRATR